MNRLLNALLTIVAVAGFAQVASAQYMYLDANENGVHDTGDRLNANGTPTTVDLYVRTNQNRDGSTATCDTEPTERLSISVYWINLMTVGGTVAYSDFVNLQPTMTVAFGELNPDGVRYKNGFGGAAILAPGQYRLCTLTITGVSGSPRIDIVDLVNGSVDFTGFGTQCPGRAFDNVYRLDGPNTRALTGDVGDFTDWDGLAAAGGPNTPPVLAPIGNKTACGPGSTLTFTATATDADLPAQTLTFSLDPGAPAGATINGSTGAFSWTPSSLGTFPVTVRVTDNGTPPLSDFEAIAITVPGSPPVVLAPVGSKTVDEGSVLSFTATATHPDVGAVLTFSLGAGSVGAITPDGVFSFTPSEFQGGTAPTATIIVTDSGACSDSETITILVNEVNTAPALAAIGNKFVDVGSTLAFTATATDTDIPANVLAFSLDAGAPPGATMNSSTGAFLWTPSAGEGGIYVITVRVTDNGLPSLSDSETITVTVVLVDGHPTADAGGPYSGIVDSPVSFDGSGSSDPAGEALTYAWDFGDGSTSTGITPMHTYTAPGTYIVTLRVTDPAGNFDEDTTTATIGVEIPVALLLKKGKSTIDLTNDDVLKVAIEEVELSYSSVILSTLRLSTDFPNAGTVAECAANTKHARIGDLDRNGVPDLELRFSMACIRDLFRNTPNNSSVNLIVTGEVQASAGTVPLRGVTVVTIKTGGGGNNARVLTYPNPFNPQARLSFVTTRAGNASIQLFDLQGRLVRTLLPQQYLGAGVHEVAIDGRNDKGLRLSSGIYFYRALTADGVKEGSISVLK